MKLSERMKKDVNFKARDDFESGYKSGVHCYISAVEELEKQKEELIKCIKEINNYSQISDDRFSNYSDIINVKTDEILQKIKED